PAYRSFAPWDREADRAQDLSAGVALFRPARLRRADEPGTRVLSGNREAAWRHGAQARATHPRPLLRDRALALASPQCDDTGVGGRRAHAAVMGLRGTREADGVLRARLGRAHARELFSGRRSAPGLAAEAARRHLGVLRSLPQGLRRHRGAA